MAFDGTGISPDDFQQLQRVEAALADAIKPFQNGRTEAALVVYALTRTARAILLLYPPDIVAQLTPVLAAFINGATDVAPSASPIWMPPQTRPF